ncbi:MAG: type II toxin-antitoxin system VapC family toxin [Candidatus Binataceae bacterium]
MSLRYLVDTDWVIHYLNSDARTVTALDAQRADGVGISPVSIAELYEGVYFGREPQANEGKLRDFLAGITGLGLDEAACRIFGRERGGLRAARKIIGDFDLLIAATALQRGLILLTNNRRHFERVERLRMESL